MRVRSSSCFNYIKTHAMLSIIYNRWVQDIGTNQFPHLHDRVIFPECPGTQFMSSQKKFLGQTRLSQQMILGVKLDAVAVAVWDIPTMAGVAAKKNKVHARDNSVEEDDITNLKCSRQIKTNLTCFRSCSGDKTPVWTRNHRELQCSDFLHWAVFPPSCNVFWQVCRAAS